LGATAREKIDLRIVFAFLKDLVKIFSKGSDNLNFKKEIETLLIAYKNPEEADKIKRIEADLEEVKGIMRQNLDAMIKRGEQLDQLDATAVELETNAGDFRKKAKEVKEVVWWRDLRCKIITGIVLIIVILIIIIAACGGFEFPNCKSKQ